MATHDANARTRSTLLDPLTAAALDEWQQRHGVRSASLAIAQLLRKALATDTSAVDPAVDAARVEAWESTRQAVLKALESTKPGGVRERVRRSKGSG